jgi:hypothetical protein
MIQLVRRYSLVSSTLNGSNVPVPEGNSNSAPASHCMMTALRVSRI